MLDGIWKFGLVVKLFRDHQGKAKLYYQKYSCSPNKTLEKGTRLKEYPATILLLVGLGLLQSCSCEDLLECLFLAWLNYWEAKERTLVSHLGQSAKGKQYSWGLLCWSQPRNFKRNIHLWTSQPPHPFLSPWGDSPLLGANLRRTWFCLLWTGRYYFLPGDHWPSMTREVTREDRRTLEMDKGHLVPTFLDNPLGTDLLFRKCCHNEHS